MDNVVPDTPPAMGSHHESLVLRLPGRLQDGGQQTVGPTPKRVGRPRKDKKKSAPPKFNGDLNPSLIPPANSASVGVVSHTPPSTTFNRG